MTKVIVGKCEKCGRELKVKEGAEKPLMRLTCTCGWSGYVGYSNCIICGKKLLATAGNSPGLFCSKECEEKWHQKLQKDKEDLNAYTRHEKDDIHFLQGSLPGHWRLLSNSAKFWNNEQSPLLKPVISLPYLVSLDVSPDQQHLVWVSPGQLQELEIVVYSTITSSEVIRLPYPAPVRWPSDLEPSCRFVGNDRILVISELQSNEKNRFTGVRLALYEIIKGSKLAEVDIPDFRFQNAIVRHSTGTVASTDSFKLFILETADDRLTYTTLKTDQILAPGPSFAHDEKLYVMFMDGLYCVEGEKKNRIMGGANCVCFLSSGKVYCGGGNSDFSGDSALQIGDLNTGAFNSISWGKVPIHQIEPAGNKDILTANLAAGSRQNTGRFAFISYFSLTDESKRWAVCLDNLAEWRNPLLTSSPEEGWALVTTGSFIRRISLPTGKSIEMIPALPEEFVEARWLSSVRLLCIARNPNEWSPGKLEWYKI